MANEEQLKVLRQGVGIWNKWREENRNVHIDLNEADLSKSNLCGANLGRADLNYADLSEANLSRADLSFAQLGEANLWKANLSEADLSNADFFCAYLSEADLSRAELSSANLFAADLSESNLGGADLVGADLSDANLSKADLRGAFLIQANLVEATLDSADLTGCMIYGVSAWGLKLKDCVQKDLIITPPKQPIITVDNLEVAQFIYLLLNNEKIRQIIDTITSKVVLILGRFMPERRAVLDAIREELRKRDYVPVLFDFEKPDNRDFTETVSTLARMASFIIADITDPNSIPLELQAIIPDLAVPVQPLLAEESSEFSMFRDLRRKYNWVLPVHSYKDLNDLILSINEKVIAPAEAKANELKKAYTGNQR